ncbi:hypothetical protein B0H10DRAFT_815522 [Mycena sp. CBHHK59/15]|nr:hypothetical protein B0H10DRAFT_815522 [Mycena sp. CBHHK59/15]
MTTHSLLFNSIVDREHNESRTSSPGLGMHNSRSPSTSSRLGASSAYWRPDHNLGTSTPTVPRDYHYSQYRTESMSHPSASLSATPRASTSTYSRSNESSNPTIDFSGLIPMYGEPGSPEIGSRAHLIDLPYGGDWPTSNMAQYATFQRNKPSLWQSTPDVHLSTQHWNSALGSSTSATQNFHEYMPYSPPSPYSSTTSSSPSPSYFLSPSTTSSASSSPPTSRRGSAGQEGSPKKSCFHCHVTSTPLWRREPSTQRPLCNACGLYLQQRNKLRPQELIDADIDDDDTPQIPDEDYTGPKCSHCLTRQTSVWRRSKTGAQVCNACGVYARLRGKERPLSLRRNKIKPRTKHLR